VAARPAIRSRKGRHQADRGETRPWPRPGHNAVERASAIRLARTGGARRLKAGVVSPTVTAFAPAKINLYLHVTGRRADGYHLLDSLVVFADIGDTIAAAPAHRLSLAVTGPEAGALAGLGDDNLVLRAARRLAEQHGIAPRAALRLDKQLPVASGIGGGSSDAAAALRALAVLWARPLDLVAEAIAIELGADVPACLAAGPVWVAGIGERLDPAPDLPPLGIVLANPRVVLPTANVFRARQGSFSTGERPGLAGLDIAALIAALSGCRNDLTAAAVTLVPQIAAVLDRLAALPGALLTRMSGSGATCFALFADRSAARHAAAALQRTEPGWWSRAGTLLAGPPPLTPAAEAALGRGSARRC
jgi:4-diphosphocytidyl-2-C-methyl-D-erythritol kinase